MCLSLALNKGLILGYFVVVVNGKLEEWVLRSKVPSLISSLPLTKQEEIVAPHTGLLSRTSWPWLAESSLSVQQHWDREQLFEEYSAARHPLPDLGQPCVHLPAQSCFRAIEPTTEQGVEVTSALGHHSSLLDLGQWARCSLHLLIPEVPEQFPPLPKCRVLEAALWLSREQCQNEGSAKVALTDSWTRTWLDHQACLSSEGNKEFLSSSSPVICVWQRLTAANSILTPRRFEGGKKMWILWLLVLQTVWTSLKNWHWPSTISNSLCYTLFDKRTSLCIFLSK